MCLIAQESLSSGTQRSCTSRSQLIYQHYIRRMKHKSMIETHPALGMVRGSRRCDGNRSRDKSTSRSVRRLATPLAAAQTVDSHARSRAGMITPNIDYIVHEYSLMLHMSLRRPLSLCFVLRRCLSRYHRLFVKFVDHLARAHRIRIRVLGST